MGENLPSYLKLIDCNTPGGHSNAIYPPEKMRIQNERYKILLVITIGTIRWLCFFFKIAAFTGNTLLHTLFPVDQNCSLKYCMWKMIQKTVDCRTEKKID